MVSSQFILVYFASRHLSNELLLWMIKLWMKIHLVRDNNYNIGKNRMSCFFDKE